MPGSAYVAWNPSARRVRPYDCRTPRLHPRRSRLQEDEQIYSPSLFLCIVYGDLDQPSVFRVLYRSENEGRVCGCILRGVLLEGWR